MNQVRRRVLRPAPEMSPDPALARRQDRQREQLTADRLSLRRWMTKLKRAFNTVDRLHVRIARLERQLAS
jgi:hypothetical protein